MIKNKKKIVKIESGKVYHVPLSWFIKSKSIYVQKSDGLFHLMFPNIRDYFAPSNLETNDFKHV